MSNKEEIDALKQCPKCGKWTNIIREKEYLCWNCDNGFKEDKQ